MSAESFKRKLTAILSADVKGYSRLMGENEAETVKTLTTYRKIMAELIQQHRGRVIDSPGDNILAEFASVVDAVQCSVAAQNEFKARNAELPENRRMEFRIGVNLGDVIEEENRIYGDGVNIAARLEALADAGGICISKTAFDHIETKLPLGYEYLGEQTVKNIAKPVGAYRVLMEPRVTVAEVVEEKKTVLVWQRKAILAGGVALVVVVIAVLIWNFYFRPPPLEVASKERMAFQLPDEPSIAVLPFVNMSEDPKQEYFSDGLTEEIITALSKVPRIFVIARNSTFSYKGKSVKINQVAEELGVQYVLEGGVRRSEDRVRITAQLIDALTGHHLWAERYDRDLTDIFALQDEITLNILQTLQVKLTADEHYITFRKGTDNLQAYLKILEAREYASRSNKEGYAMAGKLAEEAITLDPDYPGPYLMLSAAHLMEIMFGTSKSPKQSLKTAEELVQKALALDDHLAEGYGFLGRIYLTKRQYEKALTAGQRACDLAPNSSFVHAALGFTLRNAGRPEEAITYFKKAIRLNPFPPAWYLTSLGGAYFTLGRHEEAIAEFKKGLHLAPESVFSRLGLAAAYSELGREEHARVETAEVLKLDPKFTLVSHAKGLLYKNKDDTDRYLAALRKAGLPEEPPLPLPDKPSIAVLPFVNMSEDKSQEYFSDGITEEIITALSKVRDLFVIARNSSFTYKGKAVRVPDVARELGVRYILEGSVRKAGDKVRITAQLIDGATNHHVWAETYDRELKDVFAIQDEVTIKILASVKVKLAAGDALQTLGAARRTSNLQAYLKILEGIAYERESKFSESRKAFEEALSLDPNCVVTYVWLAWSKLMGVWFGPSATRAQSLRAAFEYAEKGLALDDSSAGCHRMLGHAYLLKRDYDKAIFHGERSVELDPNSALSATMFGWTLRSVGRYEEAVKEYERAMRLNPMDIQWSLTQLGTTYVMMKRHEEAIGTCRKSLELNSTDLATWITLVMAYSSLDRMEEAHTAASEVLKLSPNFSVEHFAKAMPYKNEADREFMANALRKAGIK